MSLNSTRMLGILLWTQALFLASTFRSWWVVISVATVASLLVAARTWWVNQRELEDKGTQEERPAMPRVLRWVLLFALFVSTTLVVGIWRISSQVGDDINPVYVGVDIIAHASMIAALMIWVMCPQRGHIAMLPMGLVVLLLTVAAGGASVSIAAQTTVALAACLAFTIGSQIILGNGFSGLGRLFTNRQAQPSASWLAAVFSLLTISVLMIGTSAIANATNLFLPSIQARLQEQLQATLDSVGEQTVIGGTRYVRGSRLGSIRRHMMGNPQEIALKVYCEYMPGYLRGSVFDSYRGGRWRDSGGVEYYQFSQLQDMRDRQVTPTGRGSTPLKRRLNRPLQRFSLVDQSPLEAVHMEIHNDPLKGPIVFLPLSTYWIEARSRELALSTHGIVRIGVDVSKPYVAGVGTALPQDRLVGNERDFTTDLPDSIAPVATEIANKLCEDARTPTEKADAISQYFQSEYTYSLTRTNYPRGTDPLTYFLTSKHDAHCEYFASATVMMLRSVGIPARYVTGYVVDEPSEDGEELWLARNQDAHAWAEAFDDVNGRWFPVESTPGRVYRTVDPNEEDVIEEGAFAGLFDEGDEDDDSLLGRAFGWLSSMRATDALLMLFRIAQFPLFIFLLYILWTRYLRPAPGTSDSIDLKSRKMLRSTDRKLRKLSLVRRPSETLYQFADRVDASTNSTEERYGESESNRLAKIADWYRYYANERYQGRLPSPLA